MLKDVIHATNDFSDRKTFALNVVAECLASKPDAIVHWIDTTGDFSVDRAAQIVSSFPQTIDSHNVTAANSSSTSSALNRLHVSLAFTVESVTNVLGTIRSLVKSNLSYIPVNGPDAACNSQTYPVRLIVIDQLTTLFSHILTNGSSEGHAMLTVLMRDLRDITETFNIFALVLNSSNSNSKANYPTYDHRPGNPISSGTYSTRSNNIHVPRPALGSTMTFLADTTLWLSRARTAASHLANEEYEEVTGNNRGSLNNLYTVEILRSRNPLSFTKWAFTLEDNGVIAE